MSERLTNIAWKVCVAGIFIILILLPFVPMGYSWHPPFEESETTWNAFYIWDDPIVVYALIPFYLVFAGIHFIKHRIGRIILRLILFLCGSAYFMYGSMAVGFTLDYYAGLGDLLILSLAVGTGIFIYLDWGKMLHEKHKKDLEQE